MQNRVSPNARLPAHIYWETIYPYGTPGSVSTLTVLLSYTDFGSDFSDIAVFLDNTDSSNPTYLLVEPSHGGVRPLDSARVEKQIAASMEDFVLIEAPNPFTYLRVSAHTQSPSFPAVNVSWAVIGKRR